ncbi:MAG: hypothetical protein WCJ33_03225 [Pseudomonadota bacterium]
MSLTDTIVADASPLIIAAHIGMLEHLPAILGNVTIPPIVAEECTKTNKSGAKLIANAINDNILTISHNTQHEFLSRIPYGIDSGEAEAIALALNLKARLLIDDKKGRKIAKHEGLGIFDFGVVLVKAKRAGVINAVLPILQHIDRLQYRISEQVTTEILTICGETIRNRE